MHYADGDFALLPLLRQMGFDGLSLVHRLDAATSGLMLVAKNAAAASHFSELFALRKIEKYYLALSDNKPSKKQGQIIGDMKNVRKGNYTLTRSMTNPAYTQFFSHAVEINNGKPFRLFLLRPLTGKTHQLRVALKSLGAPILGDERYAKTHADRMYLHAWALRFTYQDERFEYVQPPSIGSYFLSSSCQDAIDAKSPPWKLAWPTAKPLRTNHD